MRMDGWMNAYMEGYTDEPQIHKTYVSCYIIKYINPVFDWLKHCSEAIHSFLYSSLIIVHILFSLPPNVFGIYFPLGWNGDFECLNSIHRTPKESC